MKFFFTAQSAIIIKKSFLLMLTIMFLNVGYATIMAAIFIALFVHMANMKISKIGKVLPTSLTSLNEQKKKQKKK